MMRCSKLGLNLWELGPDFLGKVRAGRLEDTLEGDGPSADGWDVIRLCLPRHSVDSLTE